MIRDIDTAIVNFNKVDINNGKIPVSYVFQENDLNDFVDIGLKYRDVFHFDSERIQYLCTVPACIIGNKMINVRNPTLSNFKRYVLYEFFCWMWKKNQFWDYCEQTEKALLDHK